MGFRILSEESEPPQPATAKGRFRILDDETAKTSGWAKQVRSANTTHKEGLKAIAAHEAMGDDTRQTRAAAQDFHNRVIPASSVLGKEGMGPASHPVAFDWEEIEGIKAREEAKGRKLKYVGGGSLTASPTLVDETDQVVAVLSPMSNYDQGKVPGANVLDRFAGGDVEQAVAALPAQALLGKGGIRSGVGFRELGAGVGEKVGEAAPEAGMFGGKVGAKLLGAGAGADSYLYGKMADVAGDDNVVGKYFRAASEDRKEVADDTDRFAEYLSSVENEDQKKDISGQFGKHQGATVGSIVPMVAGGLQSKAASMGLGKTSKFFRVLSASDADIAPTALKAATKVAPRQAAAASKGLSEGIQAAGAAASEAPGARWFSDTPAIWGAKRTSDVGNLSPKDWLTAGRDTFRSGDAGQKKVFAAADIADETRQAAQKSVDAELGSRDSRLRRMADEMKPIAEQYAESGHHIRAVDVHKQMTPDMALAKASDDDLVMIKAIDEDMPHFATLRREERVGNLPAQFEYLHGRMIPAQEYKAIRQSIDPNESKILAQRIADGLDKLLGLKQKKAAITVGNFAFHPRNHVANFARMVGDEGTVLDDLSKNIDTMKDVANAPLDGQGPANLLHRQMVDMGLLGHGFGDGMETSIQGSKLPSMIAGKVPGRVGKGLQKAAGGYERGRDFVANKLRKPAEAFGDSFSALFDSGTSQLPAGYGFEDGLKILTAMEKIKRGVPAKRAILDTKRLFIDYADKSALEHLFGTAFPFVRYYTGMAEGALRIAAKNPKRLGRVVQIKKAVEDWDAAEEGGAMDPRARTDRSRGRVAAVTRKGDDVTSWGIENPVAELSAWGEAVTGGDRGGLETLLGPAASGLYETFTGRDVVTDAPALPISETQMGRGSGGLIGQGLQAYSDDQLGAVDLAYPFLEGIVPDPYLALLRLGGVNSRVAKTQKDVLRDALNLTTRSLTGAHVEPQNFAREAARRNRALTKAIGPTAIKNQIEQEERGYRR